MTVPEAVFVVLGIAGCLVMVDRFINKYRDEIQEYFRIVGALTIVVVLVLAIRACEGAP